MAGAMVPQGGRCHAQPAAAQLEPDLILEAGRGQRAQRGAPLEEPPPARLPAGARGATRVGRVQGQRGKAGCAWEGWAARLIEGEIV